MFIDEGFLKNAKKIASTQPQNSEAKVPAIRRENFDCHIEISVTPYKTDESSDIYRIIKTIKKSVLLKETGNEIITIPDNLKNDTYKIYEFDADLFKTFDSIYEFCNNLQYISTNIELKLEIKISEVNGSSISVKFEKYGDRYKITKNRLFLYSNYNYSFNSSFIKLCMFLGLYKNGIPFVRWMNRNDIKFLLDINYNRDDLEKLYPVHILNMEKFLDLCVIKKITYMDIDSEQAFKSVIPIYGSKTFSEDDMSHLEITYKIYEFDADLFKTFDSIYEFCNNLQYISTNIELKLEIKISEVNGSSISVKFEKYGDRYKITKNRLFLYSNYNYSFNSSFIKLCMFLGLYKNGIPFVRWMNRNDIKFLLDINYNRDDLEKLYPVHILNMEKFLDLCVIKKITYMDIDSEQAFKSVSPIYGCRTFSEDDMSHLEITYDNIFSDTSKIGADNIIYADTYYDNTYSMYFIDPIYNEGSSCYCYVCIVFELSTEIMNTFLKNELETDITDEIDFSSNIIDPYEYARIHEEMIKQLYYKK